MKINEFTNTLKTFVATVKVNSTSIKTSICAESTSHAHLFFQRLYGSGNVSSLSDSLGELEEQGAGTDVTDAGNLQVKAPAYKAKQITQQKKELQARQALAKAQMKMRDASKPLS